MENTGNEIRNRTNELFALMDSMTEEDKVLTQKEIFRLNLPMIRYELGKLKARFKEDYYWNNYEDYEQALSTGLWESILKFNPDISKNLYTFASFFFKQHIQEITRDNLFKGGMSEHAYQIFLKIDKYTDECLKENGKIDMQLLKQKVVTDGAVPAKSFEQVSVYIRNFYAFAPAPLHEVVHIPANHKCEPEEMVLEKLDQKILDNVAGRFSGDDMEKEMACDLLEDGEISTVKYKRLGITSNKIKYMESRVRKKLRAIYNSLYSKDQTLIKPEQVCKESESVVVNLSNNIEPEVVNLNNDVIKIEEFNENEVEGGEISTSPLTPIEEFQATSKVMAIDTAVEVGIKNHIRNKVMNKLNSMTKAQIEQIITDVLVEAEQKGLIEEKIGKTLTA